MVPAGAERSAATGKDNGTYRVILCGPIDDIDKRAAQRIVHGVMHFGPVEGNDGDTAMPFHFDPVGFGNAGFGRRP